MHLAGFRASQGPGAYRPIYSIALKYFPRLPLCSAPSLMLLSIVTFLGLFVPFAWGDVVSLSCI